MPYKTFSDGRQNVKIEGIKHEFTKTGTPKLGLKLRVQDGDMINYCLWWSLWLTEKALNRTIETLEKMGYKGDLSDPESEDFSFLIGLDIEVSVKTKPAYPKYPDVWFVRVIQDNSNVQQVNDSDVDQIQDEIPF